MPVSNFAEAVISLLARAVREILGNHAPKIGKSELRYGEGNSMFRPVFPILPRIPVEASFSHEHMVSGNQAWVAI
jgi:hypothetical protein